jgi:RimJ/RimL family protein N-acetyltransferase
MIRLRAATRNDWATLLEWRNNEPNADAFAGPKTVAVADHLQWLDRVLADPAVQLFIAEDEQATAIGYIRLDGDGAAGVDVYQAEISISVDPRFRGRGHATRMIKLIFARLAAAAGAYRLTAKVLPTNAASLRLFSELGFAIARHSDREVIFMVEGGAR